ncbi:hypothetical protein Poly41_39690 [Novipirellula artificiosorum]|uniref:Uncharacterized protein n=1 Tax=Novipirellula artificiosorum TaxID=2528016 RepID=A0A5C6DJD4_9BACT|nr:hypothetical protein Poly41_39690 [Novipirellula artificiosorum]
MGMWPDGNVARWECGPMGMWPDESMLRRIEKSSARSGPSPSLRSTPPAARAGVVGYRNTVLITT